jgi:hypothetical protein
MQPESADKTEKMFTKMNKEGREHVLQEVRRKNICLREMVGNGWRSFARILARRRIETSRTRSEEKSSEVNLVKWGEEQFDGEFHDNDVHGEDQFDGESQVDNVHVNVAEGLRRRAANCEEKKGQLLC